MPHIHDKIDFTASVYIVCEDKVLLRFHEKIHLWLVPGGHIELTDDPIQTVYKEAMEEVGLKIEIIADPVDEIQGDGKHDWGQNLQVPMFINRHRISDTHEHVDFIYAAKSDSMDINPQEGESNNPSDFRWVTAEELQGLDDVSQSVKHYGLTALEKVKNYKS